MSRSVKLLIICLTVLILVGCRSNAILSTESMGLVISVDGDRVLVAFDVKTEEYGDQMVNSFYIPGHHYGKGDRYPDPCKDPHLFTYCSPKPARL